MDGSIQAQQRTVPPPPGETPLSPRRAPAQNPRPSPLRSRSRANGKIQKSLVRITATEVEPDYRAPWNSGGIQRGVGAGFVIEGNRIMTNAHVVSNSPLPHGRARRRSQQISRHGSVCRARLRSGAAQGRVARFFQEHDAADVWRDSGARIGRVRLRLSARGRANVGDHGHRFADRFPALHAFVDRPASRDPDQRADQSRKQRRAGHAKCESGRRGVPGI